LIGYLAIPRLSLSSPDAAARRQNDEERGGAMSFFGLGPVELLLIAAVAGLIFGVGRMPEIAGALGKSMREFKTSVSDTPPAPPAAAAPRQDVELRREEV